MSKPSKRTTVYLDPVLHKALRIKAIETEQSVSELINEFVERALKNEPSISYEEMLQKLKKDGKI